MHVRRRQSWATDDRPQPLMPCSDPLWLVEAPLSLSRLTGIDQSLIPESRVSVFAVPLGEDDWPERGLRRWEGVRTEAMWHPLLWLPSRLAAPLVTLDPSGEAVEEPLDQWQARVAFEVVDSQLYTADGWVDVLAIVGIDVDDPAGALRVRRWLDGSDDPELDAVDLEPFFTDDPDAPAASRDSDWSSALAATAAPLLEAAGRALMADALLALAFDLTDSANPLDDEAYARGAWWLASLAAESVAEGPDIDTWMTLLDEVRDAGQVRDRIAAALRPSLRLLTAVRDGAWPSLAELERLQAPQTAGGPAAAEPGRSRLEETPAPRPDADARMASLSTGPSVPASTPAAPPGGASSVAGSLPVQQAAGPRPAPRRPIARW